MNLTSRIALSLFLYCVDLFMAILGWTIGFGLTVQNWPALIGFAVMARWIFHVMNSAIIIESNGASK